MYREYWTDCFFRNMSHLMKPFYISFIGKRSPMTMLLTIMKREYGILYLIGQFSFARNSLYMARSLIFFAQHNKTTRNVRSFALPKTIRVILGKLQEIERTQRAVYFQLRAIFYTLGVMYKVRFKESGETKVACRFFRYCMQLITLYELKLHDITLGNQNAQSRSERPILEKWNVQFITFRSKWCATKIGGASFWSSIANLY